MDVSSKYVSEVRSYEFYAPGIVENWSGVIGPCCVFWEGASSLCSHFPLGFWKLLIYFYWGVDKVATNNKYECVVEHVTLITFWVLLPPFRMSFTNFSQPCPYFI